MTAEDLLKRQLKKRGFPESKLNLVYAVKWDRDRTGVFLYHQPLGIEVDDGIWRSGYRLFIASETMPGDHEDNEFAMVFFDDEVSALLVLKPMIRSLEGIQMSKQVLE